MCPYTVAALIITRMNAAIRYSNFDRSAAVAVYCSNAVCNNSHVVATRLAELGYTTVFRYIEGKQDWIEAGLPVESTAPVG